MGHRHLPISSGRRILQQQIFNMLRYKCTTMRMLTQVHAQMVLNGLSDKFLLPKLMSFCATSGDFLYAYQVFKLVDNLTLILWNQLIRGFARTNTSETSFSLFNQMQRRQETKPDSFTFCFLLNACRLLPSRRVAQQIHSKLVRNSILGYAHVQTNLVNAYYSDRDLVSACQVFDEIRERCTVDWNVMIRGYLKCGNPDAARRLFDQMPERNTISWTIVISGCAQMGRCKEALSLFRQMQRTNDKVEIDQIVLLSVLSACAELGALDLGRWVHAYVYRSMGPNRLVSLSNALVYMYCRCGLVQTAYQVFKKMSRRTLITWTTMINGFAMHGLTDEAVNVFECMCAAGVRPDGVAFIGVLCACMHAGWVERGWHFFKSMTRDFGISPQIVHYGCMVDLLGRAGLLDEAQKLIETMPVDPNDAVWVALLAGCRIHGDIERAKLAATRLVEMEPENAGYLVLLSNTFAVAQRWDDLFRVRELKRMKGMKKPAGCSWIEVNGVIHEFAAGDRSHRLTAEIYVMLDKIIKLAKFASHNPDGSQPLLDIEEEEKEDFLTRHSEKLAIAFGLISTSPDLPIRIYKNIRICNDCHAIAKIASEAFDREISIRDRTRFHHFQGGFCTCNDYW